MKKNPKCKLTDAMLSEIAKEAEQQLMDEMTENKLENMPEHIWTKGWDDVLQRATEQDTILVQEK